MFLCVCVCARAHARFCLMCVCVCARACVVCMCAVCAAASKDWRRATTPTHTHPHSDTHTQHINRHGSLCVPDQGNPKTEAGTGTPQKLDSPPASTPPTKKDSAKSSQGGKTCNIHKHTYTHKCMYTCMHRHIHTYLSLGALSRDVTKIFCVNFPCDYMARTEWVQTHRGESHI